MIEYIFLMTVLWGTYQHFVPTHLEQFMCFVMIYSTRHVFSSIISETLCQFHFKKKKVNLL